MQITSQTYRDLLASGAPLQARATIGGVVYTDISAPVITRATMQDRLSVGNVVSASLALAVRGAVNIPRSAAVVVEVRLNDGQTASEWLPQGTFYISRRMRDPVTGLLALECYDALLKANAVWTPSAGAWPRTMAAVTAELAALLGVTLDSRTVIPTGAAYAMSEPAEGTTIRDVLGVVAQAAGGNWVMTPAGLLRLVRVGERGGTVDVTGVVGGIDVGQAGTVTGVRSTVDGVVTLIGDDTGIVVDVSIAPMIAAEMAEDLIGQAYAPFHLSGAIYDPAAELGDDIRAGAGGEVISALCSEQATYGPAFRGDIAAPDPGEVTDEYPYIGSAERTLALAKAAAIEAVDRLDDALTQREIFNRLTDNGAAQGLLLYNGQLYINASYINTGYLNVGRINFNEPDRYYDVPNENDPDSLLSGQTVVDGWIVNASGTGEITVFSCGFAIPLRGKTITVTFAHKDNSLSGGTDSWSSISSTAQQLFGSQNWNTPSATVPNPYTHTVTVPDDAMSFRISVECSGVRQIEVSLDSPIVPSDSIEYNYEGQRIGESDPFHVYRDGTLITWAKSIFRGAARFSGIYLDSPLDVDGGGTGATTAAQARANLEVLRTGQLSSVNLDTILYNYIGTVWDVTGTGVSVFGSNCGTLICTDIDPFGTSGTRLRQIFMNFFGNDIWIRKRTDTTWSEWTCLRQNNGAVPVSAGGTGATTAADARANLGVTPANIGAVAKSGDTINGNLIINGNLTVNADGNIGLTSDYEVAIGDTDAKIVKHSDGTVHMQSSGDASVYVTNGGNAEIRSDSSAASIILTPNGDVNVSGDVALINSPEIIQNSGYIFGSNENGATYHALKLGHIGDNVMQFFEYGGQFDFIKSMSGSNTTLFQIKDGASAYPLPVNNGGTGATTAAGARANIGAVAKSGDTINGNLIINGNLTVNADGNIGLTSDYGVTIGDTDAKIVKLTDGTVYMQSSGDASVYVTNGGNAEIRSDSGAASIILTPNGDVNVSGDVALDAPLPVTSGGTGATTAAQARANLEVLRTGHPDPVNLDTILYNYIGTVWDVTGTGVSVFGSNCGTLICTDVDPFGTSGSRLQQIFMNFFGNDIWIRKRTNTTWSEWTCLRQNNGAVPVSAGGTGATTAAQAARNITGFAWDIGTENTTETWVPVLGPGAAFQHRILPTWLNYINTVPVDHGGTGATDVSGAQNNILSGLFRLYDGGTVSNLAIGNRTAGRVTVYRYGPNTTGAPVSTAAGIAVLGVNLDNANYGWMLSTSDIGMYWRALDGGSYGAWKAIAIP